MLYLNQYYYLCEKLANVGLHPNTCVQARSTIAGLIEPIHHHDWINLPFEGTSPIIQN